jgi:hypothetical protein
MAVFLALFQPQIVSDAFGTTTNAFNATCLGCVQDTTIGVGNGIVIPTFI